MAQFVGRVAGSPASPYGTKDAEHLVDVTLAQLFDDRNPIMYSAYKAGFKTIRSSVAASTARREKGMG